MTSLMVVLRDLSPSSQSRPIEVELTLDDDVPPEIFVGDLKVSDADFHFGLLIGEFVKRVRQKMPFAHNNFDVYIGFWGNQETFEIPQEFFDLIAEIRWKVTWDFND